MVMAAAGVGAGSRRGHGTCALSPRLAAQVAVRRRNLDPADLVVLRSLGNHLAALAATEYWIDVAS
jgi:hypothetical protein